VVALVPAHNEAAGIEKTILSLLNQTYSLAQIVVICDNCIDNTQELVERLMLRYPTRITCTRTINNKAKKAGALNWGYQMLSNQVDFVVQMDADTILLPNTVEIGIREFERPPLGITKQQLGGVCSRFLVAKPIGKMGWLGQLMWRMQNIEYSMADSDHVGTIKENARVLSGTCSIYQKKVLDKIAHLRPLIKGHPQIWSESSIVEDFALTLDTRMLGYSTRVSWGMLNRTNVPESFHEYWRQRERWYSGTIDELRKHGIRSYTLADTFTHFFGLLMTVTRSVFYGLLIWLLFNHISVELTPLTYIIPFLVYFYNAYRCRYLRVNRHWIQYVMVFSLIPLELYALLREVLMLRAYYLSFFKRKKAW